MQDKNANQTKIFWFIEEQDCKESYRIGHHLGKKGLRSPVGSLAGVEKLVIGTRTDLNGNDQSTKNQTTKQIYGTGIPSKVTTVK